MMEFDIDWDEVKELRGKGNDYLKLNNGVNKLRLASKPIIVNLYWLKIDGKNQKVVCLDNDCPLCTQGEKPQRKFAAYVFERDNDEKDGVLQIVEFGQTVADGIKTLATDADYGNPLQYDLKISKSGSGLKTEYAVTASPKKTPLDVDEIEAIKAAKPLKEHYQQKSVAEVQQIANQI